MKAQRRHELKTNTLAEAVVHLPNTGKRNAATAITIILAGLLIGLLIRYRLTAAQERADRALDNLAGARDDINEIKQRTLQSVDPSIPQELFREALTRLDAVETDIGGGNSKVAAEALVARGDAAWYMKEFDASTTQPSTGETPSDLLTMAESAYQKVIKTYPDEHFSTSAAHLGLAAIAEDRHDWAEARKQYQAVADDANAGDTMQTIAKSMMKSVDDLEHPPVIAPATQASIPAIMGPVAPSTTQPAIQTATQPSVNK